jgi:hypothetical protein
MISLKSALHWCLLAALAALMVGCNGMLGNGTTAPPPEPRGPEARGDVIGRQPQRDPVLVGEREPVLQDPAPAPETAEPRDRMGERATRVATVRGEHVNYPVEQDGIIYVQEAETGRLIYSGFVRSGEQFDINPLDNRAAVDGRTVLDRQMDTRSEYRIYFEPAGPAPLR